MIASTLARKLRVSGMLLLLGMLITILSLIWRAPLAFLMFACVGGVLVFAGIAVYLYSLVDASPDAS